MPDSTELSNNEFKKPKERKSMKQFEDQKTDFFQSITELDQQGTKEAVTQGPEMNDPGPTAEPISSPKRVWLEFLPPSQIVNWQIPQDFVLMGDCHLTRGGITILGGTPGIGKSRAALGLAIAGATGQAWLGYPIHHRFRTLIIQAENGRHRLKQEVEGSCDKPEELDDWIRITTPPSFGLALHESGFRQALEQEIANFRPGLVVFDPWNRACEGDKQADYRVALDRLLECLPTRDEDKPGVLILHHLRKQGKEATGPKQGRSLLEELAGSYTIGSAARCVFALQAASNQTSDPTVVLTCCKNNDGKMGDPSAWLVRNGIFPPATGFDMEAFLSRPDEVHRGVSSSALEAALQGMAGETKQQGVKRLVDAGVCKRSKAYAIFEEESRHPGIVEDELQRYHWRNLGT